jgi:DNA-binding response OmpR family regulator
MRREPSPDLPTGGTESLLVVEDDPKVRDITVRTLTAAGYRVRAAPDGESAIALIAGGLGAVDLLVTDVVMPGASGRDVARAFQDRHPDARVLFVSGYTQDAIDRQGALAPGTSFLPKPFTPAQLLARVRAVLDAR